MSGWTHPNAARQRRSQQRQAMLLNVLSSGECLKRAAAIAGVSYRQAKRYKAGAGA